MDQNRIYGGVLIASVVGFVVTAAFHPVHGAASTEAVEHVMRVAIGIHALALVSVWLSVVGLLGLSRHLGMDRPEVVAALSAYAMAVMAVLCAASISGFVSTNLVGSMLGADETARHGFELLLIYSRNLNGAFAKVHVAASSFAIVLWSVAMWRSRFARGLAIVGFVSTVLPASVIFNGKFTMNVHDLALVVLAQSVWMVWAGILLIRRPRSVL